MMVVAQAGGGGGRRGRRDECFMGVRASLFAKMESSGAGGEGGLPHLEWTEGR